MVLRSKSGVKRARQAKKRNARNLEAKKAVKNALKAAQRAIKAKAADAQDLIRKAISVIDKSVQRGIVPKNQAARKKSRLAKKLNA
ncbi:MAG: 30S ribosomal protein S20 [Candidatus Margulisiibacteriota bacterium]